MDIKSINLVGKPYFDNDEVFQDFTYKEDVHELVHSAYLGGDGEFSNKVNNKKQKCIDEIKMTEEYYG